MWEGNLTCFQRELVLVGSAAKKDRVENKIQGVGTQSRGASPARSISLSCHGVERMCCHLFHSLNYVFYISPLLLISFFEKSEHNVPI